MPNKFRCPSCGTPLDPPNNTAISIQCPSCHAIVLVPEELRWSPAEAWLQKLHKEPPEISPTPETIQANSARLSEMAQLARAGKKIEAIKIYREIFGVGLVEAKAAIERLQATGRLDAPAAAVTHVEMPGLTEAQVNEIAYILRSKNKIEAIKRYRQITNAGLNEAKNAVEVIEKQQGFLRPGGNHSHPGLAASTFETPPFPPADAGMNDEKSSGARTFRLIVGVMIILMIVAIAVLALMLFTGH